MRISIDSFFYLIIIFSLPADDRHSPSKRVNGGGWDVRCITFGVGLKNKHEGLIPIRPD